MQYLVSFARSSHSQALMVVLMLDSSFAISRMPIMGIDLTRVGNLTYPRAPTAKPFSLTYSVDGQPYQIGADIAFLTFIRVEACASRFPELGWRRFMNVHRRSEVLEVILSISDLCRFGRVLRCADARCSDFLLFCSLWRRAIR